MKKKCRVALVMGLNYEFHSTVAHFISTKLKHEYSLTPINIALNQESIRNFVMQNIGMTKQFDVLLVIGQRGSVYLRKAIDEIGSFPIIFIGIPDPVELGLIDALDVPGKQCAAVIRKQPPALEVAEKLLLLSPYINKVILPYWQFGDSRALVDKVALIEAFFTKNNIKIEVIKAHNRADILSALEERVESRDIVLFLEGSAGDTDREAIYLCWDRDAVFCGNSIEAMELGATCSFGGNLDSFAEETRRILNAYWIDKQPLGLIPVRPIANNRVFNVNIAMFRMIGMPEDLIKKLIATADENIVIKKWVPSPL